MTQSEIEAKAKVAAVKILEWCYDADIRIKDEPNFVTDTIARLMREAYEAGQQEQHKIDEIHKKTIEERAYKAVPDVLRINDNYVAAYVSGYRQGAADQHNIDINKACDWINGANEGIKFSNLIGRACGGIDIEMFRKAMEYEESN